MVSYNVIYDYSRAVVSVSYIFVVIYKYKRRRKGSYNVYRSRLRETDSSSVSTRSSFRTTVDYYSSVAARGSCHSQGTITGSESVDSFERMSTTGIGQPLFEPVTAEVTEPQVESTAIPSPRHASPAAVAVGTNNSRRMNSGFGTLYTTEQKEMYFSL